ncbi:MAG: DUF6273 domain-containing protein [Clostridia bacterium]|nr:DUF6273 domain-containing protein [Clostridia bacterium]
MEKKNKKAGTVALAVALATTIGFTSAYLVSLSDDVTNIFNPNKVAVELTETTGSNYDIIPGTEQEKDPTVKVDTSVDAYAYVIVTDETNGVVGYDIADGWTKMDNADLNALDTDGDGTADITLGDNDTVYYREVAPNDEAQSFPVLKDNKVSYSADLTNEDMPSEAVKLAFVAYAIQKTPFIGPVSAWNQAMPTVGDLVKLGTSEKTFYVTKVNGTNIEVLDQQAATSMKFDADGTKTTFGDGNDYLAYAGSDIDKYLEETYYPALPDDVKAKIVAQNIKQSAYYSTDRRTTEVAVGDRHAYPLDMDVVGSLTNAERAEIFADDCLCWLRSAGSFKNTDAWYVNGQYGYLYCSSYDNNWGIYAAFTINLEGLDFEILE